MWLETEWPEGAVREEGRPVPALRGGDHVVLTTEEPHRGRSQSIHSSEEAG